MKNMFVRCLFSLVVALTFFFAGCGGGGESSAPADASAGPALTKIVVQMDWYPQPEHGGFYQALAEGYYEAEGLDVEIMPGGPNAAITQKVSQGKAQFGIGRTDDIILGTARGMPLLVCAALMQKDPQAVMFHEETGIESFADLDGRNIMATPGSVFIEIMERKFDIEVAITPLDYGMTRFLADKDFIQQCFITNEPYYVRREGANPGTLLISDSGFRPYRVWFTSRAFARNNPEVVKAFNRATIKGWESYLFGDNTKANAIIKPQNPKMSDDFMAYSRDAMIRYNLVTGDGGSRARIGHIDKARLQEQIDQLVEIGMIEGEPPTVRQFFNEELLPEATRNAPAPSALKLHPERRDATDLEIYGPFAGFAEGEPAFIRYEDLLALDDLHPWESPLELVDEPVQVEGLDLATLWEALGVKGSTNLVLADCSDGYQGNYGFNVLTRNRPMLFLRINGQTVPDWAASHDRPEWGPYIIYVSNEDGLKDPSHKNPWGVERMTFTTEEAVFGPYLEIVAAENDPHAGLGLEMFIHNCSSCHNAQETAMGGSFSTRPLSLIAMFAQTNEAYFRDVVVDPAKTNPLAERMPAHPHYTAEDLDALVAFMEAL